MASQDDEILQEFLIESSENLARLDREMVELEKEPDREDLLASVFRTFHTIKGTCGFLGFSRLEALTHAAEDILNDLRQGRRQLDQSLTSVILQAVDAVKRILGSLESGAGEGPPAEADALAELARVRSGLPAGEPTGKAALSAAVSTGAAEAPAVAHDAPAPAYKVAASRPETPLPEAAAEQAKAPGIAASNVRVDVGLLDRLMNLVGELVLTRNQVLQYNSTLENSTWNAISQRLNLITRELQESVMKTRMQPIGLVWNKLPRIVRDLAAGLGKEIDLEMEGAGTELDRAIIEAIRDPLTHIVRNSCDHGIEMPETRRESGKPAHGRLLLRAYHEGGQVNIEISDDGAGIDPERVKAKALERQLISADQAARISVRDAVHLVFLPGFSTAARVTNLSGRGVGMDVVKTHIERIGGTVELVSEPGRGTSVRIRIPLTLAIIPGLVVTAGEQRFVIPQVNLDELISLEGEAAKLIQQVHSTPVFRRRNTLLPVADLNEVLDLCPRRPRDEISIVVVRADAHRFGLIVDEIGDCQEIVVKPMGRQLKAMNCYAGATIMGDGRIALILDVVGLGLRCGLLAPSGQSANNASALPAGPTDNPAGGRVALLLCRAGSFERLAIPLSQVARLEQIPASSVERAGGRAVVQYRHRILPLLEVDGALNSGSSNTENLSVVVYRSHGAEFGLVVNEISDIVEETIGDTYASDRSDLLGSAVIGGRVTDFLDVEALARQATLSSPGDLDRLREALSQEAGACPLQESLA